MEKLLKMGERFREADGRRICQGCGKGGVEEEGGEGEGGRMNRCKGCESVWYCGKVGACLCSVVEVGELGLMLIGF